MLIGWDGADWNLIDPLLDAGKLPNLERLVRCGVAGNLATLTPPISPVLWTSIATGKRPFKHGVLGFTEPDPRGGIRPVTNLSRTAKAVWNILSQEGNANAIVGWWPSHPAEPIRGVMVSNRYQQASAPHGRPWPLPPATVHPQRLAGNLERLRVHPQELDPGLIGLFLPNLVRIDQDQDGRVETLAKSIAETATIGRAASAVLHHEPWDFAAVYFDGIDHICHGFMPYHPPRLPMVSQADFENYRHVVESGYRYHDLVLGGLLTEAGEDTLVILISDHGFKSGNMRLTSLPLEPSGPTLQHRHQGILVMSGPGIKTDERIYGANLLDICPTILAAFGLPVGRDMDGVPLVNAFARAPRIISIDSWEAIAGSDGRHPPETQVDPLEAREAVQRLVDLGYIDAPNEDQARAAEESVCEIDYNRALAYMDAGRHAEALPLLKRLAETRPDAHRFGVQLVVCSQALGRVSEAGSALERLLRGKSDDSARARAELIDFSENRKNQQPGQWDQDELRQLREMTARASANPFAIHYLTGCQRLAEGRESEALEQLEKAHAADPRQPGMHVMLGEAYLRMRRWKAAEDCFIRAIEIDPDSAAAYLGQCRCLLPRRRNREAAEAALDAIGLVYYNPTGHFLLGVALHRLGRFKQALTALEVAVAQNPNSPEAHRLMARIQAGHYSDPAKADRHRRMAGEALQRLRSLRKDPAAASGPMPRRPMTSDQTPSVNPFKEDPLQGPRESQGLASIELDRAVVVVSGLPRSGTSMLMQMLSAGGMTLLADDERPADPSNPRGYFEYEPTKRLLKDNSWLEQGAGKAIKIVAPLLEGLKPGLDYRVLFIERDMDEVIRSQRSMLAQSGHEVNREHDERLKAIFIRQVKSVKALLYRRGTKVLFLDHDRCLASPADTAGRINAFLGGSLDADAMAAAVDPALHRTRRRE